MAIRLTLKIAILAAGRSQRQIAAQSGIHENRLSEIVCGWTDPRAAEREAIAAALGKPVSELFDTIIDAQRAAAEPSPISSAV